MCGTENCCLLKSFLLGIFSCLPCLLLTSFAHKDVHSMEVFLNYTCKSFFLFNAVHILTHKIFFEGSMSMVFFDLLAYILLLYSFKTFAIQFYTLNDSDVFQYPFSFSFLGNLPDPGINKRDIVFLLDGSDDSRNGLLAIREFIRRMAEDLDIDQDIVRVAVIQYSEDALPHFLLNTYNSKKAVIYAINGLTAKGGRNLNIGAALKYVRDHVFTTASGSRHQLGVPQLLIFMTGGGSSDEVAGPAEDLKNFGVLSIAIGIKKAVEAELKSIAFSPRFLFNLPVFGELLHIQPDILSFIKSKLEIEPPTIIGKNNYTWHFPQIQAFSYDFKHLIVWT